MSKKKLQTIRPIIGKETIQAMPAWQAYLLVFITSACSLIIELVAGRIMAPIIGVSLYTWTSIIGVCLAGISLGNFLGGKIADRYGSRRTLFALLIISGLSALSVLFTAQALVGSRGSESLPLLLRIVVMTGSIFFLPSCVLGTISPLIVKLTLNDLTRSGDIVGKIYAVSTAGSILGTFATGFYLVSVFGTRTIMLGVGIICFGLAFIFGDWSWRKNPSSFITTILLVIAATGGSYYMISTGYLTSDCLKETDYYCIRVLDETKDDEPVRSLVLDHLVHSFNSIEKPEKLTYGYEFTYAAFTEYLIRQRADQKVRVLFIGGGGYTFPRYIQAKYPGSTSDVIEIDPEVTNVAISHMGLVPGKDIRSFNMDARLFLKQMPPDQKYDLIIGDAFHGVSVPYHLTTREFNDMLRNHLVSDGFYILNLIDGRQAEFARSEVLTLRSTFNYVAAFPVNEDYKSINSSLWVVAGSQTPLKRDAYISAAQAAPRSDITQQIWEGNKLNEFMASGQAYLLTDEYAPVDNLLAPVFEERGI